MPRTTPRGSTPGVPGPRVVRNFDFLYRLCATRSPRRRMLLLRAATPDQMLAVVDVGANLSRKRFALNARQSRRLAHYDAHVKKLGRVRSENAALRVIQQGEGLAYDRRRDRISVVQRQKGRGFLPAVLVPVLVELAAHFAEKLLTPKDEDSK
jgi:hypothetical protein